jgi:hypothetical protein
VVAGLHTNRAASPRLDSSSWVEIQERASASVYGNGMVDIQREISGSWRAWVTTVTSPGSGVTGGERRATPG